MAARGDAPACGNGRAFADRLSDLGELKNPGLWMFAILAAVAGAARGYWLRLYVDHSWRLIRLQKAYDCLVAAAALIGLSLIEIALAAVGPADHRRWNSA